ncbi:MAG TPA: hypothetical protein VGI46_21250 [Candidatus Acidoferrum sp.]|jgi:uncharacterized protein involved in exopolysaccharide biosynthesis
MENMGTKKPANYDIRRLTLRDMTGPLFRNWRAVAVTFCSIFAISIFVARGWASHYYVATMQVVVARGRSNPTITGQQNPVAENNPTVTADDVASEIALLQGRDMLQEVAQICNLTKQNPSVFDSWKKSDSQDLEVKNSKALESATNAIAGGLRVEAERTSHVIDVKYGDFGAPETPACVLQTLGKLYLAKHLRLERPAGAFNFFAEETEKYQKALMDSEMRLADFSKSEGVAAPETLRTDMAQQLVTTQASLSQTRQMISANQQRLENLRKQMEGTPPRSSTAETSISANILLEQLQSSLLASHLKKTQLLMKYDAAYPLVQEADAEIAQTQEAIAKAEAAKYVNTTTDRDPTFEYLRQDQAKTEADLASEQATATALLNTIHGVQSELVSLDMKAVRQGALLREAKANEGNYLLYLTKREQERTSDALDEKRIANVAIAVPANVPALPALSSFSIMLNGFLLALVGGIGAGYLAEVVDPSFRTPAEVEELLNIAVLAAVPKQAA